MLQSERSTTNPSGQTFSFTKTKPPGFNALAQRWKNAMASSAHAVGTERGDAWGQNERGSIQTTAEAVPNHVRISLIAAGRLPQPLAAASITSAPPSVRYRTAHCSQSAS